MRLDMASWWRHGCSSGIHLRSRLHAAQHLLPSNHSLFTYRYGGMFYAIVDAASVGLQLEPSRGREICRLGK